MEFRPILLSDKSLFNQYFAIKEYDISELTFTNLFMWQKTYNIQYSKINDFLVISARTYSDKPFYLMPIGGNDIRETLDYLTNSWQNIDIPIFRSLTKEMIIEIENARPGMFTFKPEVSSFEYVYSSQDLILLLGKKYHAKRNHINKFLSLFNYKYIPYNSSMRVKCSEFLEKWFESAILSNENLTDLENEKNAIYVLLDNFDYLNVIGGLIEVDDKIIAFSFGQKLTRDMFLIHIEKADKEFHGSYAMINNKFSAENCTEFKYINREEDMGIEGLRKAKMSYNPVKLIEKYSAFMKQSSI